jgi:hypothetical protein
VPTRLQDLQVALLRGPIRPPPLHLVALPQVSGPRDHAPGHTFQDHPQHPGLRLPFTRVRLHRRGQVSRNFIKRRRRGRVRRPLPDRCALREGLVAEGRWTAEIAFGVGLLGSVLLEKVGGSVFDLIVL